MAQRKEMVNRRKAFRAAYLELTNVCNGNCAFCPGTTREPCFMDPFLFRRLAEETAPLAEIAYLHVMGEALLHPEFPSLMETALEHHLMTGLTTNGTLFDTPNAEALFCGCFRQVNVSLHAGITNEKLEQVIGFTKEAFRRVPGLYVNYRFWNIGEAEERTKECLALIEDRFGVHCIYPELPEHSSQNLLKRLYLNFDTSFTWPDLSAPPVPEPAFCHGIRNQFAVLADGQVTACCLDHNGDIELGDASKDSLRKILSNARSNAMRRAFQEGRASEELCRHCTYRVQRFSGKCSRK